ncbi:MAG: histidine phosphatase family protein [Burkholderiaceae bacterium]|nr:histidine phosphatase family protein [Roseateles sp.]MBV8470349.1 histidine phosphatase family protein [Burkholderiaceae bacterium]
MPASLDSVTQVLCVRHGETDWNKATRIQGQLDIPLSAVGFAQARALADALEHEALHAVYASDLARAMATALTVSERKDLPLLLDTGLRERHFGDFQGLTWLEIEQQFPQASERWRRRDPLFAALGGENLQQFYARCVSAVEAIARQHLGQTILVVAHGGVLDCLYRAAMRLPLEAPRTWMLGNAVINRLIYTPQGFGLVGWNDGAHLERGVLDEGAAA